MVYAMLHPAVPTVAYSKGVSRTLKRSITCTPLRRNKIARNVVRAVAEDELPYVDSEKALNDLKTKWDGLDNKPAVIGYGLGSVAAVWVASGVIGAVDSVPLVGKLMELVGLVYSSWFTYRYLLFKSNREELYQKINDLKKKLSGSDSAEGLDLVQ